MDAPPLAELEEPANPLGLTAEQWAQWQAYTHGYGEQDANGIDVSLLRQNLLLTPTERLRKHQRALKFFMEDTLDSPINSQANDFQTVIAALDAADLRFVIIGGIAMRLQGAAHVTDDIDFAFARDTQNLERLVQSLAPYRPRLRGAPPGLPFFWDVRSLKTSLNLTLDTDIGSVDLLGEPAGIASFEDLWQDASVLVVHGIPIRVASIPALIAMKRAAGRPKDQNHLMELERLLKLTTEGGNA